MLCDPDYANKVAAGQADLIRPCIMCNHGCTDAIASRRFISCVLNAENGYEYKRVITPAETPRRVAGSRRRSRGHGGGACRRAARA